MHAPVLFEQVEPPTANALYATCSTTEADLSPKIVGLQLSLQTSLLKGHLHAVKNLKSQFH